MLLVVSVTKAVRVIERRSLWMWCRKYIRATILFNVVNRCKYRPKLVVVCTIVVENWVVITQIWNRVRVPGSDYKSLTKTACEIWNDVLVLMGEKRTVKLQLLWTYYLFQNGLLLAGCERGQVSMHSAETFKKLHELETGTIRYQWHFHLYSSCFLL